LSEGGKEMPHEQDGILQYSADELKGILENQSAKVIDVRTEEEYGEGHIPSVPLRPMQDIMDWAHELSPEEAYIFVCRSGSRSQRVAAYFQQNGFSKVANYAGGMLAWDGETTRD
jgi:rhodanese-related sulfurtransferase